MMLPRKMMMTNFVAGDWVGSGFLADACFSSAREIAHLIIGKKRREDIMASLA